MDWLLAFLSSPDSHQGLITTIIGSVISLPFASDYIRHNISQRIFRKDRIAAANNYIIHELEEKIIYLNRDCTRYFESLRLYASNNFKVKANKLISKDDALISILERLSIPAYNNTPQQKMLINQIVNHLSSDKQLPYEHLYLDYHSIPNSTSWNDASATNPSEGNDDFISKKENDFGEKNINGYYTNTQIPSQDFNSTATYHAKSILYIVFPTLLLSLLFGILVGCISLYLPLISVVQIVICIFTLFTIFELLGLIINFKTKEIIEEEYIKRLHFKIAMLFSLVFLLMLSALLPKP